MTTKSMSTSKAANAKQHRKLLKSIADAYQLVAALEATPYFKPRLEGASSALLEIGRDVAAHPSRS